MKENEINIYFFDWFSKYCKKINLNYIFNREKELNPLSKISMPWKTLGKKIIEYEYPPLEEIKLQTRDLEIGIAPRRRIYHKGCENRKKELKKDKRG